MAQLTLSIQYSKNRGNLYSAVELANVFFFGAPLADINGNYIPDETIDFYIQDAQQMWENLLSVKMQRMVYEETKDYSYDNWLKWGYIKTSYPVVKPLALAGFINTTLQVQYPNHWLSFKKQRPDEFTFFRKIELVPITGSAQSGSGSAHILLGVSPYIGYFGSSNVPNYWTLKYQTGFHKVPADIMMAVGKQAAIGLFTILGDIVLGTAIASKSQSIDGLSQSVGTTASAMYSAFSARIVQYEKELKEARTLLARRYGFLPLAAI